MYTFTINSSTDNIENAEVFGTTLQEAIEEIIHLNGHTYLSDTDWDVYNESDGCLVVENGLII